MASSLHSLEALKPWNIHALAKRQLQRDLKYIYKAGPCSPLRAVGRAGHLPRGGGKKPSSAPCVPSAPGAPCPAVGPRHAPALPPTGGRLRESQTPRNSLLLDRRNTKG